MAINFPDTPIDGDTYTFNGRSWVWVDAENAWRGLASIAVDPYEAVPSSAIWLTAPDGPVEYISEALPDSLYPLWNAIPWYANYEPNAVADPTDGALVEHWREAIGFGGLDALMPVEASRPVYRATDSKLNGQPAVEFDGVDDYLRASLASLPQSFTVVFVCTTDQADYVASAVGLNGGSANRAVGFDTGGTGTYKAYMAATGNSGGQPVVDRKVLIEAYYNTTSSWLKVNGVTVTQNISTGAGSVEQLVMGANHDGTASGFFDGHLGVVGVFMGDLSAYTDWSAARAEICTAYGITYETPGTAAGQTFDWSVNLNADSSPASDGAAAGGIWTDDSGNGRHLYQDNPSQQALKVSSVAAINNQPAFDFVPGSLNYYFRRRLSGWLTTTFSMLAVVVLDNADYAGAIISMNDVSAGRYFGQNATSTGRWYASIGGTGSLEGGTPATATAYLVEVIAAAGSSTFYVNGTAVAGPAAIGTLSPNVLAVGAALNPSPSVFMDGRIATVKVFAGGSHRDASGWSTELAAIKTKYGFTY